MATFKISADSSLYYEYTEATTDKPVTFVFFNALTGDADMWQDNVADSLISAGHGILVYNMRGQRDSPYPQGLALDQSVIVNDALQLIEFIAPPRPIFVGLSIGGIFAAWASQQSAQCAGMVFINTLRRDGPRLQWINDSVVKLAELGGGELLRDVMSPLIMNEDWQAANRKNCLDGSDYSPIDKESGTYNLLSSARSTNWDFPYEELTMPTLVMTGAHDRVFRDPADIDALYARLPNARRLEVPDAGHMIPVENPGVLSTALLEMAKRVQVV